MNKVRLTHMQLHNGLDPHTAMAIRDALWPLACNPGLQHYIEARLYFHAIQSGCDCQGGSQGACAYHRELLT